MLLLSYSNQELCTVYQLLEPSIYAGLRLITVTPLRPKVDTDYDTSAIMIGVLFFIFLFSIINNRHYVSDGVIYDTATKIQY